MNKKDNNAPLKIGEWDVVSIYSDDVVPVLNKLQNVLYIRTNNTSTIKRHLLTELCEGIGEHFEEAFILRN